MVGAANEWHREFYLKLINNRLLDFVTWKGVPIVKNPLDMIVYQELLWSLKPNVLVETGTALGGSAGFFADLMEGYGRVVTIDIAFQVATFDPRIDYLTGSSTSPEIVAEVAKRCAGPSRVMVVLDSHHEEDHVYREMELYAPFVTPGSYMVVEDSNIGGHPVENSTISGEGPWASIHRYLKEYPGEFEQDLTREKYGVTFNPGGWLRKVE